MFRLAARARRSRPAGQDSDGGHATAELALGLPSLVAVLLAALWMISAATAQARCAEAARLAARAAARGETDTVTRSWAVRAAPPGASVTISRDDDSVRVEVAAALGGQGYGRLVPPVRVSAAAVAPLEEDALSEPDPALARDPTAGQGVVTDQEDAADQDSPGDQGGPADQGRRTDQGAVLDREPPRGHGSASGSDQADPPRTGPETPTATAGGDPPDEESSGRGPPVTIAPETGVSRTALPGADSSLPGPDRPALLAALPTAQAHGAGELGRDEPGRPGGASTVAGGGPGSQDHRGR